jgi:aryl-alcohol dehydrogenase-like predicted oxidoreductase
VSGPGRHLLIGLPERPALRYCSRKAVSSASVIEEVAGFMLYRRLGRTGLRVSEIGLGCASFWGKRIFSERDAVRLVHAAAEQGVTFFDTGPSYSGGNAEPRLGRALAALNNKNDLVVATTVGTHLDARNRAYRDWSPGAVRASVEQSLRRLKLDTIALLQLHGAQIADLSDGLLGALARLKQDGKIRHLGVNSFDMDVIAHVMTLPDFAAVMIDYNVLRPRRAAIIEQLAARDFGILAGQALAGGLHSWPFYGNGAIRDLWYAARAWTRHRADLAQSRRFRFLNDEKGWTAAEIALAWVLANQHVSCAVFGTTRLPHLLSALNASGRTLDENLLSKIERAAAQN